MWRVVAAILIWASVTVGFAEDYDFSASMADQPGHTAADNARALETQPVTSAGVSPLSPLPPLPPPSAAPEVVYEHSSWFRPSERPAVNSATRSAVFDEPPPQAWYTRLDYYYWDEQIGSMDFVNESGMLATLGRQRRWGMLRYRTEMFGGVVDYKGFAQSDGDLERLRDANGTTYLGCRGECEWLWEPEFFDMTRFYVGIGSRLWIRSMDDMIMESGYPCRGYQETWWTFYPYVGIETRETDEPGLHVFGGARFGLTPWTYEHSSLDVTLHPECGITSQAELGLRSQRLSLSAFVETMTWAASQVHKEYYQPDSALVTLGARLLYRY